MTGGRLYDVEPWRIRESRLEIEHLAHSESVFALSNGHIGLRGNLDPCSPTRFAGRGLAVADHQRRGVFGSIG